MGLLGMEMEVSLLTLVVIHGAVVAMDVNMAMAVVVTLLFRLDLVTPPLV